MSRTQLMNLWSHGSRQQGEWVAFIRDPDRSMTMSVQQLHCRRPLIDRFGSRNVNLESLDFPRCQTEGKRALPMIIFVEVFGSRDAIIKVNGYITNWLDATCSANGVHPSWKRFLAQSVNRYLLQNDGAFSLGCQ